MKLLLSLSCVVLVFMTGLLIVQFYGLDSRFSELFYIGIVIAVVLLLMRGFILVSNIQETETFKVISMLRAHIVLHLFPIVYLWFQMFSNTQGVYGLIWIVPFIIFFYTGRRSWLALFKCYQSKMYYIFIRGNTGMIFTLSILSILSCLALLFEMPVTWEFVSQALSFKCHINFLLPINFFNRLLSIYFLIHFLLIGLAILKIDWDVSNALK